MRFKSGGPSVVSRLLCQLGAHHWGKPRKRRSGGFLRTRRRCQACKVTQERQFPGGEWKAVTRAKRTRTDLPAIGTDDERLVTGEQPYVPRTPKLHPLTEAEERQHDAARGELL